ncbi:MAG: hypothetical protein AAF378_13600 [Cyanobacteria bacterium P01_A01_bin.84]
MEVTPQLGIGQIVYLEKENTRLYAEVVQIVVSRQLCWVRPLLLIVVVNEEISTTDLRNTSDLLWSLSSFKAAIDTDVITWLAPLMAGEPKPHMIPNARQKLHKFINNMWEVKHES